VLISAHDIGHRFGRDQEWLYRHLSYEFRAGGVYAITGPSGCGKSTLLSVLAGLSQPTEGRIGYSRPPRVSWVFQNPFGTPRRKALDHVALPIIARGIDPAQADEQALGLLARFDLEHVAGRAFRELSGGEAQRLMLARGLASRPELLLVDEPTAQLDVRTAQKVNAAIRSTADPETVVVVATHDERTRESCTDLLDLASLPREPAT